MDFAYQKPTYGQLRVSNELKKNGMSSPHAEYAVFGSGTAFRLSKGGLKHWKNQNGAEESYFDRKPVSRPGTSQRGKRSLRRNRN
jgi:hypothetical protein